jgi:hypothetical protein
LYEHSFAETLIRAVLAENLTLGLDALLFDAVDVSAVRPMGLRHGVSAIAATASGGSTITDLMTTDLANLAAAIAPLAGNRIAFVASPKQAVAIQMRKTTALPYPVFASAALADKIVMAIALNSLVAIGDDQPRFEVSDTAVVHMEQDSPLPFSTSGTPATIAAPLRSTWQTDSLTLRFIMEMNWQLRVASGAISWTENVNW